MRPGSLAGLSCLVQPQEVVDRERRARLEAQRVAHAAQELDVGAVGLARAVADPQHVGRAVVPVARGRIDAGQRLLVLQQQRLVAGEEVGLGDLRRGRRGEPAGRHEVQRLVEARGKIVVALRCRRVAHEVEVPAVDLVQVGIAALGEGAQQVQRRGRLVVGLHHALGIGQARLGGELEAVDVVAAVGRQLDLADLLDVGRARLGELAGHAADLHHRHAGAVGQHDGHLQQHAERVADVVGGEILEALGAVAALQQEGVARGHLGQRRLELARLAGEDQRRIAAQPGLGARQNGGVRIDRHLLGRPATPARRRPVGGTRTAGLRFRGRPGRALNRGHFSFLLHPGRPLAAGSVNLYALWIKGEPSWRARPPKPWRRRAPIPQPSVWAPARPAPCAW